MSGGFVMVIDDDDALRESVCELLQDSGYRAAGFDSGATALASLREPGDKPDIILLDLMMPVMNGWEFREQQLCDASLSSIPVVVMTANRDTQGISADEILYKPVRWRELLEAVQRNLRSSGSHLLAAPKVSRSAPSPSAAPAGDVLSIFAGGGELCDRMRAYDWENTPLGPVETWPQSLRSAVSICLGSQFPIALYWGRELTLLYNDRWSPIPGSKHPWALGRRAPEVWPEIWDAIGPLFDKVLSTGEGTYFEDALLPMRRHGYTEECYFNFTFSPVRGEGGGVDGVFNAVVETTFRVVSERRTRVLRDLGERIASARSAEEASELAIASLGAAIYDVPFCALYLSNPGEQAARLVACAGLSPGSSATPEQISLERASAPWPFAAVRASGKVLVVSGLTERFGFVLPGGAWPEPARDALIVPLLAGTDNVGFIVLGANPRRAVDEEYRQFAERAALLISKALASAAALEAARKKADVLVELDRTKTAFFSNVSHELRTPLTLMLGPTEDLLAESHGPVPEEQRRQLELLHRNALRLQKLVNSLLDFSRLEAGHVEARYEPLDLSALTRDLASTFHSAVERAGLRLIIDCKALEEPIYVDRDMWEKIVFNLLSNALKFTFEGYIEVSLRREDGQVVLRVRDSGVGIPKSELPRLFERFHRVEGTRARTHEGSGIGLALVQEFAKLHGGSLTAESELGKGSVFTVRVPEGTKHLPEQPSAAARTDSPARPLAKSFVEEATLWSTGVEPPVPDAGSGSEFADHAARPRILVADDNADLREYLTKLLKRDFLVEVVADGNAALAAARARPPELVLTDVMMPGLDGFALLRELRSDAATKEIPVVMLSAGAGEEARVGGLQAGADDYLVKPFAARELVARVKTQLELARLRNRLRAEHERLFNVLMQAPMPICVFRGRELFFELANPSYCRISGREDVIGKTFLEVFPEVAESGLDQVLRRVLDTGQPFNARELSIAFARGPGEVAEEAFFTVSYAPLRDERGVVERVIAVVEDVTEQVAARRVIEQSEEKFRSLVTQVQAGIAQTDLSGRFTLTNERYRELVGRSEAELAQLRKQDIIHPDDLPHNAGLFRELVEGGKGFITEKRYVRPDGSIVWVQNNVSRIDDRDGRPVGTATVATDITRRKYAEEALKESEEQLAALQMLTARLVDASTAEQVAEVAIAGSAGVVGAASGVFYRLLGEKQPAVLVAQKGLHLQARRELELDAPLPLAAALRSGRPTWLESRAALLAEYPQLEAAPAAANIRAVIALPLVVESGVIGGFALAFDHELALSRMERDFLESVASLCAQALLRIRAIEHERAAREATRRSEARYRDIFERTEVSLWEEDLTAFRARVLELRAARGEGLRRYLEANPEVVEAAVTLIRVLEVNPATLRLLGVEVRDEVATSLQRIFLPETLSVVLEVMVAIAEGRRLVTAETAVRRISGERVDIALTLGLPAGELGWERVLVTLLDISAQKVAEREREARVAEMERAVRFSETFVGILSHDLRTPLSAITTAAEVVRTRAESERIAKPLARIASSAGRMERMIAQLLDFTRIRLGRGLPLERGPVDLAEVSRGIIDELQSVHQREIKLELAGDPVGSWDRDRLAQLLSNLVANACQHSQGAGAVAVRLDGTGGVEVVLEVQNPGALPPALVPVIFEPLQHSAERAAKRKGSSGLGLGLYISQQIVLAHGGNIRVDSSEEAGTCFVIELPRHSDDDPLRVFSDRHALTAGDAPELHRGV